MAELGVGYISIVPETSKITPGIKKALGDSSSVYDAAGAAGGKSFGAKFTGAATGLLKKGGIAAGAAGGTAIAAGLTKGIGRLNSIEQAEAKLKGLGNSGKQVGDIMTNALASVKGTSFGLEEAATTAASMVASGIQPGQQLEGVLKTVGDTATIAGTSMSEMGTIFGSVAARGKLQGDDMLQLLSRGVPVLQLLGDEVGKTAAEVSDMVSSGEIDFATFEAAMRRGMGGAALEAGNTAQGAMKNMGAALGRLGATVAGPFFEQAAGGFTGVTDALDQMNDRAKPVMDEFAGWMTGTGIPAVKEFASNAVSSFQELAQSAAVQDAISSTSFAFDQLVAAGKALAPVLGQIGSSLAQASAAVGVSSWKIFVSALTAAGSVAESLAGPLEVVADLMSAHPGLVTAAVAAWAGFKTVPGLLGKAAAGIATMTGASKSLAGVEKPAEKMSLALAPIQAKAKAASDGMKSFGTSVKVQKGIAADMGVKLSTMDAAMGALGGTSSRSAQLMGAAYTDSSAKLKTFAMNQQLASNAAQQLARSGQGVMTTADAIARSVGHSAVGAVSNFAGTLKGTGAAAMSGFRSAGKGIIDLLGGPWGAAMVAGGAALTLWSDGQQKLNSILESSETIAGLSTDTYNGLFSAMASGGDSAAVMTEQVTTLTDAMKKQADASDSLMDKASLVAGSMDKTAFTAGGMAAGFMRAWETIKGNGEAEEAQKALDELGLSNEELSAKVNGSAGTYALLKSSLKAMGDGGVEAAKKLDILRDAHLQAQAKIEAMGPAAAAASEAMKEIGSSSDDAATKVDKVRRALMELNGVELTATEAQAALTEAISAASSEVEDFSGATLKANGTIDASTDAGAALFSSMMDLGSAMSGAVASGNDANQVFNQSSGQLEAMRQSAGLSTEEWNKLLEVMRLTPEGMTIDAKIANGDTVRGELEVIRGQVNQLTDTEHVATIQINDDETRQKLEAAGWDIQNYDEKTGTAKLDLSDEGAKERFNWWMNTGFMDIDMANPTAVANLDDTGLRTTAGFAQMQLDTLDLRRPTPLADMDTSQLDSKAILMFQQLGLLDGQRPTPLANMDISSLSAEQQKGLALVFDLSAEKPTPVATLDTAGLDSGAQKSSGKVDDLDKKKADPKVSLDPKPVEDGARQAQGAIDGIRGRNITVTFTADYAGDWDRARGHATGGLAGNFTGALWQGPAYADGGNHGGYRLPKTGPGTDTRDGFLAFDKNNIPAARLDAGEWIINRRNSEKYNRELAQINAGTFPKLPGYVEGGRAGVKHADEIIRFSKDLEGKPYVWGGVNWGDCSGAMSAIARFAAGLDPFAGRFATGNEASALQALGFTLGTGQKGDLQIGWFNGGPYGGHTAGTLPNGINVEMGGGRGNGQYGGPAAGALHPQFTDHAFLRVPTVYRSNLTGMPDTDGFTVGTLDGDDHVGETNTTTIADGEDTAVKETAATRSVTKEKKPQSWSEVAGIAGQSFASGMVGDLLNVLGIPDTPPALAAYNQMQDEIEQSEGQSAADKIEDPDGDADDQAKTAAQLAQAKKDVDLAEEDLRIAQMKRDEVYANEKSKESAKASADQRVAKAQAKVDKLNSKITDLEAKSSEDSDLTVDVSDPAAPTETRVTYNPALGAEQWRPVVEQALKRVGGSLTDADRTITQIDHESGGDPNATNNWDSNAANGDPSKGLLQVIGATFQAFRDKELPNDQTDPLANIVAALNYVSSRYGGPSNIWPTRAGYAGGGYVVGPGGKQADRIAAWLSHSEFVTNAAATAMNRPLLEAINAGLDGDRLMADIFSAGQVAGMGASGEAGELQQWLAADRVRTGRTLTPQSSASSSVSREGGVTEIHNTFMAANPPEMYRMYRREAAVDHRGKVGAR